MKIIFFSSLPLLLLALSVRCAPAQDDSAETLAGNDQVAEVFKKFAPRGVQSDGSQPTPPQQSLSTFHMRDGVSVDLVTAEPDISQPLFLSWDSRGRMWVVQYRQYQYPAGLKVVRFDHHLRAVFDKVPQAPPNHVRGKDRITVFEDTDSDGMYDTSKDVITGLNIATSVAVGRGGIWVLNPPYLLFYPDKNQDDIPDRSPEVHLAGFGIQDTHSVANSLLWGPDGWLYGANGSTTGGTVSSEVTPGITFQGQCIWRYHPNTKIFEIYAEGGGNTFSLDIDAKGRVFSGTNGGNTRGWYYPQGSYSRKNWGKHGPLTNPNAFGFFEAMKFKGDGRRFPQAFAIYEGGLFPSEYDRSIFAPNAMQNLIWNSQMFPDGSTYRTEDQMNLAHSSDRWFRPVYSGAGPDGSLYIADWYDTRLSHVSPLDDWHKESGRIYRMRPTNSSPTYQHGDLSKLSPAELINLFTSKNKWTRQRATLELGWRFENMPSAETPEKLKIAEQLDGLVNDKSSLESLWALSIMGEATTSRALQWLQNSDENIRRWTIRVLGDRHESHAELATLALTEPNIQVRSQLASTARRISSAHGLAIAAALLEHSADATDPHMPLLIWWAIESHADDFAAIKQLAGNTQLWKHAMMRNEIAGRLMQRYAASGTVDDLQKCESLLELAPDESAKDLLIVGLNKAFQGRTLPPLPNSLALALGNYQRSRGEAGIALAVKQGQSEQFDEAVAKMNDTKVDIGVRIEIARAFGQVPHAAALNVLLRLASGGTSEPSLQRVALQSLALYDDARVPSTLTRAFDSSISAEHNLRETGCRTLASRKPWALALLHELATWRLRKSDIPPDVVQRLRTYTDNEVVAEVEKVFGKIDAVSTPEKVAEMKRLSQVLSQADGNPRAGEIHFEKRCATCHQLFGKGNAIGPPLDNYDRGNTQFWLLAILAPGLEIREGFQSYMALTTDGRVVTGMIAEQSPNTVTIRAADNRTIVLDRKNIEQLRAIETSLMPDDVLKEMTDGQIVDLFAYLMQGVRRQPASRL